jgi:hypothetical protein
MNIHLLSKIFLCLSLLCFTPRLFAAEPNVNYKLYGFIRNDFYYNSRQNVEAQDGLFSIIPKPKELNSLGEDKNATANAEMLSIATRLGINFTSAPFMDAKTTGKIECDFSGFSTNYYVVRLRQAYVKLNWKTTEVLIGQTWHPLFACVSPTIPSLNTGAPFQPFNRSPQVRLKQLLGAGFSLTMAATYQMQYMSQGPNGSSVSYMKNAITPDLFASIENTTGHVTIGAGCDTKTIKVNHQRITSVSTAAFGQYTTKSLQVKAKVVYGQNMSDHQMIGGYGVCNTDTKYKEATYTNFNTLSSWINVVYGIKVQVGIFGGLSQNLGTNKDLLSDATGKFTAYGNGFYQTSQDLLDRLYRISPHISYSSSNIKLGLECELTSGKYGTVRSDGRVNNAYTVNNNRLLATISYLF